MCCSISINIQPITLVKVFASREWALVKHFSIELIVPICTILLWMLLQRFLEVNRVEIWITGDGTWKP